MSSESEAPPRARIPADVDTADTVVYGLTARQLAIFALAGVAGYSVYQAAGRWLPPPVLIAGLTVIGVAAVLLAVGSRDGLPLDRWLLAAVRHTTGPRRLSPTAEAAVPEWAPPAATRPPLVGRLRLPATAISDEGVVDTGTHTVALVACTTVNIGLRTGSEQAALLAGFGRWLNSLTDAAQIVATTRRVDLAGHADRIAATAAALGNERLRAAAGDYAVFLADLATRRQPRRRTITVAVRAGRTTAGGGGDGAAVRRAEQAAAALAKLGGQTAVLDGGRATAALTCAADPHGPADPSWARTRPDAAFTAGGPR